MFIKDLNTPYFFEKYHVFAVCEIINIMEALIKAYDHKHYNIKYTNIYLILNFNLIELSIFKKGYGF